MLGQGNRTAWLVRVGDAPVHVEDRMLRVTGQDFAPAADGQGFAVHAIASAAATAALTTPADSAIGEGCQEYSGHHQHETRPAWVYAVSEGPVELVQGRLGYEIGKGAKALGLQGADIHRE
jgi:hypothetical protein